MDIHALWVDRHDLRRTRLAAAPALPLADGQVRVRIDKFALTANNVSYAVSGDLIGYWQFYPVADGWGQVPVWGFADVVESRCPSIPVGERLWGFLPMASHATLTPGAVDERRLVDVAPHRERLPALYNQYQRTGGDPPALKDLEDARCLLFPLFATSFILHDYLADHAFFGARQVLVGSASSKTGLGLAQLLHEDRSSGVRVVGLTSARNLAFVQQLGSCDAVVTYDAIAGLDPSVPTAFVDMAGAGALVRTVHEHFGAQLRESCIVGATHWEADRKRGPLPGAKPQFFFAPQQVAKRDREWGAGVMAGKAFGAAARIARATASSIEVVHARGPAAVERGWQELLDNAVPPSRGLMLSLHAG